MIIETIHGDVLTAPTKSPNALKIIPHVVNDNGGWGKGFVVSLSKKWPEPESAYRDWQEEGKTKIGFNSSTMEIPFKLGYVQPVVIDPNTIVLNMLAQHGYKSKENPI